jgi:hypothetical protein
MANRRFIDFPIAASVGDNDIVLIWQDGMNKQTTKGTLIQGAPTSLEGLTDVDIAGLINGQILQYNSTTGKWENVDRTDINLSELGDVSIVSPTNGQVLVYNSSTSKWENSSGGFVPYVGAVTTVDLGAQGLRAGYVRFNTSVVSVPDEQGIMYWDADNETVDVILNGTIMQIGQDLFYPVKNQTGSTIPKGTAVRFAGTVGASGRLLIAPFIANNTVPSSRFMGVTSEAILDGADGKVMWFGRIRGINTDAFNEGDILYASTTTAGAFQTTIPVAPNNIVQVAAVVTKSINNGAIFVRPTIGSNINKDEGVKITSVADKDLLQYQSGTALWENKTVAEVIGTAYVPSTRTITINGTTQDLSANRTYNVGTVTSVGLSSATSGVTIGSTPVTGSGTITIAIATASGSQNGLLSSTDWTTFNNKQNALTNPVTGTGTTNYLPKFTGTSTIGNSQIFDNGTNVGINTNSPTELLDVNGIARFRNLIYAADGSASAPSIRFYNSNSGLFLPTGVDAIGFSVGNTERARLTSGGNLLVGTTTDAGFKLDVNGTGRFSGKTIVTSSIASDTIMEVSNTNTTNGFGLFVRGGVGSTSYAFNVVNAANTVDLFKVMGSGAATFSSNVTLSASNGTLDVGGEGFIRGNGSIYKTHEFTTGAANVAIYDQRNASGTTMNRINAGGFSYFNGGNVVIGTTTDAGYKLDVNGTGRFSGITTFSSTGGSGLRVYGSAGTNQWDIYLNSTNLRFSDNTGTGSIVFDRPISGTSATFSSLGTGTVYSNGGTLTNTNPSDLNLKTNVTPINYGLDEILKLNPVTFDWKNDTINQGKQYGFIAQEVQKIMPDLVKQGEYLGLDKEAIFTTLVKAIQELNDKIK